MRKSHWFDSASSFALARLTLCGATEDQFLEASRAAGGSCQVRVSQLLTFTVAANGTLKAQASLPPGSVFLGITTDTPVAVSGTPTSCLFNAGITDGGSEVVAAVDAKGQGHIAATVVAALDKVGGFLANVTKIWAQVVTSGGTSPAGTIYAIVEYLAPVF